MKFSGTYINMETYREDQCLGAVYGAVLPEVSPQLAAAMSDDIQGIVTTGKGKMRLTLRFVDVREAVAALNHAGKQHIKVLVATEYWDIAEAEAGVCAERHIFLAEPKAVRFHPIVSSQPAGADCEYDVSYYAAYIDDEKLWEVSPENMICKIGEVDYLEEIRRRFKK